MFLNQLWMILAILAGLGVACPPRGPVQGAWRRAAGLTEGAFVGVHGLRGGMAAPAPGRGLAKKPSTRAEGDVRRKQPGRAGDGPGPQPVGEPASLGFVNGPPAAGVVAANLHRGFEATPAGMDPEAAGKRGPPARRA